jgi:hypothetical protein
MVVAPLLVFADLGEVGGLWYLHVRNDTEARAL